MKQQLQTIKENLEKKGEFKLSCFEQLKNEKQGETNKEKISEQEKMTQIDLDKSIFQLEKID